MASERRDTGQAPAGNHRYSRRDRRIDRGYHPGPDILPAERDILGLPIGSSDDLPARERPVQDRLRKVPRRPPAELDADVQRRAVPPREIRYGSGSERGIHFRLLRHFRSRRLKAKHRSTAHAQ